jgi:hypothetical protein
LIKVTLFYSFRLGPVKLMLLGAAVQYTAPEHLNLVSKCPTL